MLPRTLRTSPKLFFRDENAKQGGNGNDFFLSVQVESANEPLGTMQKDLCSSKIASTKQFRLDAARKQSVCRHAHPLGSRTAF